MTLDEEIGRRVHMMLWDRGLTNAALADTLGLARPTVSQRLRGQRPWTGGDGRVSKAAERPHGERQE